AGGPCGSCGRAGSCPGLYPAGRPPAARAARRDPEPPVSSPLDRMMDFDLTEEQRQVRRTVRAFAEKEILPYVEEHERAKRYPLELVRKLVPLGLIAPLIPEEYGGSFTDVMSYGLICEEIARVDWVVASVVSVSNSLVASSIL